MGLILLPSPKLFKKKFPIPEKMLKRHKSTYFLDFNHRFIITKFFDIILQQITIMVLLQMLVSSGLSYGRVIILFSVTFALIHVPLLLIAGRIALFHVTAAFIGSFVFSFLILNFNYGFVYSIAAHLMGYILGRLFFWFYFSKKSD
ncbi:MAG: hypothetical protein GF368_04280 [Candidatus Aenigmarchaeota archaeon]|nr:hypothetical protein [Candidatus Aenigmarchaeota archaeon]